MAFRFSAWPSGNFPTKTFSGSYSSLSGDFLPLMAYEFSTVVFADFCFGDFTNRSSFLVLFFLYRAGDEDFAREITLKAGGMALFLVNFKMREYTKAPEKFGDGKNGGPQSRLRWKHITLMASNNVSGLFSDVRRPTSFQFLDGVHLFFIFSFVKKEAGPWERAVRGIMCGNYEAALPVAESWEDEAWIYFKCFLDMAFEKAIAQWREQQGGEGLTAQAWMTRFVGMSSAYSHSVLIDWLIERTIDDGLIDWWFGRLIDWLIGFWSINLFV